MGPLTTFFQRRGKRDTFPVSFHDDHDFVARTELRTFTDGESLEVVTFRSSWSSGKYLTWANAPSRS